MQLNGTAQICTLLVLFCDGRRMGCGLTSVKWREFCSVSGLCQVEVSKGSRIPINTRGINSCLLGTETSKFRLMEGGSRRIDGLLGQ